MKVIKSTNFPYLGSRKYVHSTSIIEFVHNNINSFIDNGPSTDYYLDIKMYKEMISNCSVEIYDTYQEHDNEEVMCEVVLKSNNSTRYIYFLNYSKAIISNRINPEYCVEEIDLYSNFSGIYRIASNTYSKCIRNIIQSNKLLHLKNISSGGWSILNMFMKNVPVEFPKYINMLDIEIKNIGVRGVVDKSFSTLNVINIPEMNIQPISVGFQVEKL